MPTIWCISDFSGAGRSSLTLMISALSHFSANVVATPTTVFSHQSDGFDDRARIDFSCTQFSALLEAQLRSLPSLDIIISSYFPEPAFADLFLDFLTEVRVKFPGAFYICDPVFGDEGALYNGLDDSLVKAQARLASISDLAVPNEFEAQRLKEIGSWENCPNFLVTGGSAGICTLWHGPFEETQYYYKTFPHVAFPGTGDLFVSILAGHLSRGCQLGRAIKLSLRYLSCAVRQSIALSFDRKWGVMPFWKRGL